MKICIISVDKKDYAPRRIFAEGKKLGHSMYLTTWFDIFLEVRENKIYIGDKEHDLASFDAIIPRSPHFKAKVDGKIIIKRLMTMLGLIIEYAKDNRVEFLNDKYFSSYQSADKLSQQYFLFKNKLPGIPSLHFSDIEKFKSENKLKFPLVAKFAQGSLGTGVFKMKDKKELKKFISQNDATGKFYLLQEFCPIQCDFRVLVVGKRALGVMKRVAKKGEWRTNVSQGGMACKVEGKEGVKIKKLAERVAKKMALDYVGVDILDCDGKLHVIEVNSLAQFGGFESAYPKINVAREIIKMMETKRTLRLKKDNAPRTL